MPQVNPLLLSTPQLPSNARVSAYSVMNFNQEACSLELQARQSYTF
jgi:hypothetical protein